MNESYRRICVRQMAEAEGWMRVSAVWRFFEVEAGGNSVSLFLPGAAEVEHGPFLRPVRSGPLLHIVTSVQP